MELLLSKAREAAEKFGEVIEVNHAMDNTAIALVLIDDQEVLVSVWRKADGYYEAGY